ncbi:uncharacterized protein LOC127701940 isoform X2 [Mytilus californianus]|uniref:uncharacterized protein LOC127701940 isoform X2 n=1 Tax=Mytilus californianus TaxID=6549 RepID=UPI002247D24E|nr:uncharacterized protein LOC127701940 isoform X2 [Mytilus californianus]
MEFSESWIYFYLFALMANHSKGNASVVSTPACLLMQRATCGLTIPDDSCVKRIDDFVVTMALYGTKSDCEKLDLSPYISCLKELRKASKYVGISGDYILDYPCMSKDDETFLMSPAGLVIMFLGGILTGVLVTSVIFIGYIRWMKDQTSKQENTYLDLDLSVDNEEKQPERTQRGSVAFVREIASVYYSQPVNVGEESPKDRSSSSVRSRIFSWSSSKSRKSFTDRKSSLNKIPHNSKSAAKQMFSYEQPVPEEGNDYVDLDSPTTSTQKLDYENENTEHKNKSNPITFIDADEDQTKNPLNVLENQTEKSIHNYATTDELHSKTENPYSDNKQKTTDQI